MLTGQSLDPTETLKLKQNCAELSPICFGENLCVNDLEALKPSLRLISLHIILLLKCRHLAQIQLLAVGFESLHERKVLVNDDTGVVSDLTIIVKLVLLVFVVRLEEQDLALHLRIRMHRQNVVIVQSFKLISLQHL